jgi:tetratricopeptide (TPR) repeat protein
MQRCWVELRNANQSQALTEIEQDIANIRTAWRYRLAERNNTELLRFIDSFWVVHDIRGWYHAGIALFEEAVRQIPVATADAEAKLVHGKSLGYLGFCTGVIGNPERGLDFCQDALAIIRPLHQPEAVGYALFGAALNCAFLGLSDQLIEMTQTMSQMSRETGDRWMEGFSLNFTAMIFTGQQRPQEAREKIDQALRIFGQEIGEHLGLTWAALVRGQLALSCGEYAVAKSYYERSLKAAQALNYRRTTQQSYDNLGDVAFHLRNVEQAEKYFRQSLEVSEETGQTREMLGTLYDLARVKIAQEKKAEAVELVAVVLNHPLSSLQLFLRTSPIVLREAAEQLRASVESELPPEDYQAAWAQGSALPFEAVVADLIK